MAEGGEDGQEKTEDPSQKRLDKAKEDGEVLSSKELQVFMTMSMGVALIYALYVFLPPRMGHWIAFFEFGDLDQLNSYILSRIGDAMAIFIVISAIVGLPIMLTVLATQGALSGGINFAVKSMQFKGNRINPLSGFKRMFSINGLMELAKAVAFVPHRPIVAADFTAREVVRLGRHARGRDEAAVERALAAVGLAQRAGLSVHTLSGGERQRVAVARALCQVDGSERPVVLLDEPFSGIDPGEVARIVSALRALAARGAVVLSLHDPGLARAVATRALVMRAGEVVASGEARAVLTPEILSAAYGAPMEFASAWIAAVV